MYIVFNSYAIVRIFQYSFYFLYHYLITNVQLSFNLWLSVRHTLDTKKLPPSRSLRLHFTNPYFVMWWKRLGMQVETKSTFIFWQLCFNSVFPKLSLQTNIWLVLKFYCMFFKDKYFLKAVILLTCDITHFLFLIHSTLKKNTNRWNVIDETTVKK